MEHVKKGCVSDHPSVNYYIEMRNEDWEGGILHRYKTVRSTSQNENWHLHSSEKFRMKTNVSIETWETYTSSHVFRWNVNHGVAAGIYRDFKTYDWTLLEKIQKLYDKNKARLRKIYPVNGFPIFKDIDTGIYLLC